MCVFSGILEKHYYIIEGPAKLHGTSYPQVLERQGEHELPKIKVFFCSVTTYPNAESGME